MIHVLNHNSEIIDFISRSDNVVIHSEYKREKENNSELLDLTILSSRAKHFKENNRIIIQDKSNQYREFIIQHIEDSGQYIDIEATASYVVDIGTAKPIPAGKYEKMSVTQKLDEVLRDTDWVTGDCDYGGVRTNSWTSVRTPYEMISQLETSHALESDFEIIIEDNEVVERRVNMKKPNSLFKGKEIEYGKDLTEMKRTVDFSEVVTALFAFGPEDDKGNRISLVVTDDEAQEQFGLPTRYIWGIYEPESDDENMTTDRLKTLARTELNKRKSATVSYEISTFDIEKQFPHEVIRFGDKVRIKNSDFVPSLYAESEVIGFTHDLISDDIVYTFGNVVEYAEDDLLKYFKSKLNEINQKLNDNITNINTIVNDAVAGELEYYERKIFKGAEPPENPQNDTLWYDTSNPDVAVLRRYWNGKWITQTADDVEKIGGLRREQVMYRDLNNSFINLTIQHSRLQNDVYDVLNNEYLVDDDLKANLNQALSDVDNVYQNIKTNLDSMDEDTATIGKLVDTQTLFTVYREKLQTLYKYVTDAKISIDKRLKLLQSQYTDEKFNDAMDKIAETLPNGRWDSENQQLYADIPNEQELSNLKQTLQDYYDGNIKELEGRLNNSVDSKVKVAKEEISTSVKSVESKVDGLKVGGRNLLLGSGDLINFVNLTGITGNVSLIPSETSRTGTILKVTDIVRKTSSSIAYFEFKRIAKLFGTDLETHTLSFWLKTNNEQRLNFIAYNTETVSITPEYTSDTFQKVKVLLKPKALRGEVPNHNGNLYLIGQDLQELYIYDLKLEKGTVATDWTPAPEDVETDISNASEETQALAKSYTESALKPITTRIITNETNISELDSKISLMAKSEDVAQKLRDVDGRLTPLETTVESNKATLDILPTQIESKVSKEDYTLDKNDIVQRLDNADSQRKQLSNEITDKVTITKFESGMTEAKNYTDNEINSLDIGSENLLLDSERRSDGSSDAGFSYIRYYLSHPLEVGKTYTLKADIVTTDERQSGRTSVFPYNPSGIRDTVDIKDGKITYTFTAKVESTQFLIYKDVAGQSNFDLNVTIEKAILVEGDKVTGWAPANEDVKKDIQQAETNAKNYTDDYKRSNDVAMTKLETSITQNGDKIALKVDEQKFNASRKTLSQVISEISTTTKGINLSYDENGNIQSYTMDENGIKINGSKIDINQGDVVIQNGVTTIKDAYIDKLFSKNATINKLNSIDIDARRIRASDNQASVNVEGGTITMNRTDGAKLDIGIDGIAMYNSGGSKRFSMDRLLIESAALGTSNSNVYLAASDGFEARVVDRAMLPSDGSISSYKYLPIRSLALKFPQNSNGYVGVDGEFRIMSEGLVNGVYRDLRANGIFANRLIPNDSTNLYLGTDSNVRLVAKGDDNVYRDLVANGVYADFVQTNPNTSSSNLYLRASGEVRMTTPGSTTAYQNVRANGYLGTFLDVAANTNAQNMYVRPAPGGALCVTQRNTTDTFLAVKASQGIWTSSEKYKENINEWNENVLQKIKETKLYEYDLISEKNTPNQRRHHGVIIERQTPKEWVVEDGVDQYEMTTWSLKAIQELLVNIELMDKRIKKLEALNNERTS